MNAENQTARPRVARVAVPVPLPQLFDYEVPADLPTPLPGARVQAPFAGRRVVGVCVETNPEDAHERLKPLTAVLDHDNFFGAELLALARWLAEYYQHPLGETLATVLPAAARRPGALPGTRSEIWALSGEVDVSRAPKQAALLELVRAAGGSASMAQIRAGGFERSHLKALAAKGALARREGTPSLPTQAVGKRPELNAEQAAALEQLLAGAHCFTPTLLDGITGSGKTEVYLRLIEAVLAEGKQVLVLVPEIALTPQTVARFEARFGHAEVMHSAVSDAARLRTWLKARRGELNVLIGTRSAALVPFARLGLIVVDEEHDASFKQQDGLRYSARDVAVKRAQGLEIPLVLGSATPSFESLHNASLGRYQHLKLRQRAGGAELPAFRLLDLRGRKLTDGLSDELLSVMQRHLDARGQVLVFLNRRGFAPTLLCGHCGWRAECAGCERPMTVHRAPPGLICHHCGHRQPLPENCDDCGHDALIAVGQGTQRAEQRLREQFPGVAVHRIDRDSTRSRAQLEAQLAAIQDGNPAILVGTQMLAKGHHFPNVTLVAVINIDGGFLSPDFRAPERTAQLIVQVAGRAGRAERPGEVYLQTYQPDSPLLRALLEDGYDGFAQRELEARDAAALPPFRPLALLRAEAPSEAAAARQLKLAASHLPGGLEVLGPAPALIARVADRYRYQLLVSAERRAELHAGLRGLRALPAPPTGVRFAIDVDPYDTF